MPRLCDSPWWPNTWINEMGGSRSHSEIRKSGVLKNVRRSKDQLTLIVECNGAICTAQIDSQLSADFAVLLRHVLLQHWGQPISVVENIEIEFAKLFACR